MREPEKGTDNCALAQIECASKTNLPHVEKAIRERVAPSATLLVALGQRYYDLGDLSGARRCFEEAAGSYDSALALIFLADIDISQGQVDSARRNLAYAFKLAGPSTWYNVVEGTLLLHERRLDDAEARFQAVIAEDPSWVVAHLDLARIEFTRGANQAANASLRRAMHAGARESVDAWLLRCKVERRLGRHLRFVASLRRLHVVSGGRWRAALVVSLVACGRLREAVRVFQGKGSARASVVS